MTESRFLNLTKNRNVVFITVKNESYIRVTQIKRLLEREASLVIVYSSEKKNPVSRAIDLRKKIRNIDFSEYDVVVAGFLPQLIISSILKKASDKTIISEMFLSMYDTVICDRHLFRDGGLIANLMKRLDKIAIENSELVITDTKADSDYFEKLYSADSDKFETIYLEADANLYNPDLNEHHGDKKVLYFGTGLPLQGTDIVMDAFDRVASLKDDVSFTYIGSTKGIPRSTVKRAMSNRNIHIHKWLSQDVLAAKIAEADLCIAGHFNSYIDKADRTIPGKAFIYEAMNKPMILGDTIANRELFTQDERHMFVKRGNAEALAECIRKNL